MLQTSRLIWVIGPFCCRQVGRDVTLRANRLQRRGLSVVSRNIHECGTARTGTYAKKSVLNGFIQAHDVKNIFVTDGAAFVIQGCYEADADHHGYLRPGGGLYRGGIPAGQPVRNSGLDFDAEGAWRPCR